MYCSTHIASFFLNFVIAVIFLLFMLGGKIKRNKFPEMGLNSYIPCTPLALGECSELHETLSYLS